MLAVCWVELSNFATTTTLIACGIFYLPDKFTHKGPILLCACRDTELCVKFLAHENTLRFWGD